MLLTVTVGKLPRGGLHADLQMFRCSSAEVIHTDEWNLSGCMFPDSGDMAQFSDARVPRGAAHIRYQRRIRRDCEPKGKNLIPFIVTMDACMACFKSLEASVKSEAAAEETN